MKARHAFSMLLRGASSLASSPSGSRAISVAPILTRICTACCHRPLSCATGFRSHAIIVSESRRALSIPAAASNVPDETATERITLETMEPFPEALMEGWYQLMRVLHQQGHFASTTAARELAIQSRNDVKTALLTFARSRGDIIFGISPADLAALAEVPLVFDGERPVERKLANAAARLHSTFIKNDHGPNGQNHASTQDLMRVLWEWACMPETQMESHAPGLARVVRSLLQQVLKLALSEAKPEHLELAQKLGTPTLTELEAQNKGRSESRAAAKAEMDPQTARSHANRLAKASSTMVLEAGDWFCAVCGTTNFRGRKTCIRCRLPARSLGNTVVAPEDITSLYGDRPPRRAAPDMEVEAGAPQDDTAGQPAAAPKSKEAGARRDGEQGRGKKERSSRGSSRGWEDDEVELGGRPRPRGFGSKGERPVEESSSSGRRYEGSDRRPYSRRGGRDEEVQEFDRDRSRGRDRYRDRDGEERRWGRDDGERGRSVYGRRERDGEDMERAPRRFRSEGAPREERGWRREGRDEDRPVRGFRGGEERVSRPRGDRVERGGRRLEWAEGSDEERGSSRGRREEGGARDGWDGGRGSRQGARRQFTLQELMSEQQAGAKNGDGSSSSKPAAADTPQAAGEQAPAGGHGGAGGKGARGGRGKRKEEDSIELFGDDSDYFSHGSGRK